jgi:putative transposase
VQELRQDYPLAGLLKAAGMARSSFYYQQKLLRLTDKYASLKVRIRSIFDRHRGRYGYRRITAVIRRDGIVVNHKTVQRLMGDLGLKSCVRVKKYCAYRGEVGRAAPNILERQFKARRPNEKWVTDVTEFNVGGQRLYLSPVLDLYNGEIVAFETARRPLFNMIGAMLRRAFARLGPRDRPLLHSDQGWQGDFQRSSQHLAFGGVAWDDHRVGLQSGLDVRRCGRRVGRASTSGMPSRRSGQALRRVLRVRMRHWGAACRSRLARAGSGRPVGWRRSVWLRSPGDICRSVSVKSWRC